MELKEAKEIVEELRGMDYLRNSVSVAAIILDDRIIELENLLDKRPVPKTEIADIIPEVSIRVE